MKEAEVEGTAEGIGLETKRERLENLRTRVKTKVESSFSQVPVSSSVHGLLGPSGCTRSKQKRLGDPIERERRARPLSFFYFAVCCYYSF